MQETIQALSKGVRIRDRVQEVITVELSDIFDEIEDAGGFTWVIEHLEVYGYQGAANIADLENSINKSSGKRISLDQLASLEKDTLQFVNLILVGYLDIGKYVHCRTDFERYELCDISIEMFDASCWEVFSKDHGLIDRLAQEFNDVTKLEPDFQMKPGFTSRLQEIMGVYPVPHTHLYVEDEKTGKRKMSAAQPMSKKS